MARKQARRRDSALELTAAYGAVANDGVFCPPLPVLSVTGPTYLLEVVAPDRATRKHARTRIDHALDGSSLEPFARVVRRLIKDAAAAAAA